MAVQMVEGGLWSSARQWEYKEAAGECVLLSPNPTSFQNPLSSYLQNQEKRGQSNEAYRGRDQGWIAFFGPHQPSNISIHVRGMAAERGLHDYVFYSFRVACIRF